MNWQEIAGNVVNALRNAGVKKDIIDLQEKQVAIFRDEVAVLTRKLEVSESETADLQKKVADLEQELERAKPKTGGLDETSVKVLQVLARHEELTTSQIASWLNIPKIKAEYHRDILWQAKMIQPFGTAVDEIGESGDMVWGLIDKGRAYLVENGLV